MILPLLLALHTQDPKPWLAAAAITADCASTMKVVVHDGEGENNPLLGRHPSGLKVLGACALGMATTLYVGQHLHGWKRTVWYVPIIAIEFNMAAGNLFNVGVRFPW